MKRLYFKWKFSGASILGASPGEVVYQVEEVEGDQEERKEEKKSKDDRGGTDHHIHGGGRSLSYNCRIEREGCWYESIKKGRNMSWNASQVSRLQALRSELSDDRLILQN